MKSKLKKLIASILLFLTVAIVGLISLLLAPQALFAHDWEHDKFHLYADYPLPTDLAPTLDRALHLIESSELYDPDYRYELFFVHQTFYNRIDNLVFNPYAAARPTDNNIYVKAPVDLQRQVALTERSRIPLDYLLVHEMVHCLQENRYGKWRFNPFHHPPLWKLEGYPEYLSRQPQLRAPDYDLRAEVQRYLREKAKATDHWLPATDQHWVPEIYLKGRLLVEYLMDIKGWTYDDILAEEVREEEVYRELLDWAERSD
ncbi:MAG: hypothetical protein AAFR05_22225 [Bacteroidota bacterium]